MVLDHISKAFQSERSSRKLYSRVMGFPEDVTEDEIVDHFSYLYDLQPDFETKKPRDFRGRKATR